MISEEIGDYTTMSNSESNSYNGTRLFDMTGANISASRNLMGRRLLKPEELSLIERPEVLIVGSRPVIMHAYDLAKTPFNKMFGLGNVKHNTNVRAERYNRRKTEKINAVVELWGIWRKYKSRHHEEVFSLIKILIWAKRFLNKENAKMIKVVKKY